MRPAAGGKARRAPRQAVGSGLSSDGESPPRPDEDDGGYFEVPVPKNQKVCTETQRPDVNVVIKKIIDDKLIIRSSQLATHVLLMGSPDMMLEPVRCPYEGTGCVSFRAYSPQHMKEHFESKHELHNVQLNFVCPCPAVCNIVNGQPQECEVVEYDPRNGVMAAHLKSQHTDYEKKMGLALCFRPHPGDPEKDADTEFEVDGEIPDMEYLEHLKLPKKFPAWTKKKHHLFPSQRIAEKVTIETVVQNKRLTYGCNLPACAGKIFGWREIGWHTLKGHPDVLGRNSQTQWFERCHACGATMHWSHFKMRLHIQAMHPELLGKPKHFVQQALEERERLQAQIQEICIGQAIADTATPGNESDGTKAHMLYQYMCPVTGCKKRFDKSEYAKWHIIVDHEKQWDVAGTAQSEVK